MANKKEFKIGVIGAGAWGTALANILSQRQHVKLWAKEKSVCENIEKYRENKRFLPNIKLSKKIKYFLFYKFLIIFYPLYDQEHRERPQKKELRINKFVEIEKDLNFSTKKREKSKKRKNNKLNV